jgi:T5orf172 domain
MGFVYVIGPVPHTDPYLVKIGNAGNVTRRRVQLQTGSPARLEILCIIQAEDAGRLEDKIHGELAEYRRHGEWFELGDDPVKVVKDTVEAVKTAGSRGRTLRRMR